MRLATLTLGTTDTNADARDYNGGNVAKRKNKKPELGTAEEQLRAKIRIAEADVAAALARVHEAEEDVREAQERVVNETRFYEHACAVYADRVSGRGRDDE